MILGIFAISALSHHQTRHQPGANPPDQHFKRRFENLCKRLRSKNSSSPSDKILHGFSPTSVEGCLYSPRFSMCCKSSGIHEPCKLTFLPNSVEPQRLFSGGRAKWASALGEQLLGNSAGCRRRTPPTYPAAV